MTKKIIAILTYMKFNNFYVMVRKKDMNENKERYYALMILKNKNKIESFPMAYLSQ